MNELEKFKREINIAEVAQLFGYVIDKEKSSRAVKALKNPDTGHKIVVSRNISNGHYIYFSVDREESGTIIDFLQARNGQNLGHTRKWCRRYLVGGVNTDGIERVEVKGSSQDTAKIAKIWERIESLKPIFDYREITIWSEVIEAGRVKFNDNGVFFPMYDLDGICGIERRTGGEKRVLAGSKKGLWSHGNMKNAKYVVVAESPIDALSYLQLNRERLNCELFLVATMGALSEEQKLSLREIARRSNAREWIIATDADNAGERLAEQIVKEVSSTNRKIEIYRHKPELGKDWNEELQQQYRNARNTHTFTL